ncbi:MAG: hypothetical protein Q3985_00765 [Eubacteriales bacterium]|nr:hypothetical protein [Eubacteriales bacterium]
MKEFKVTYMLPNTFDEVIEVETHADAISHAESVRNRLEKLGIIARQFHLRVAIKPTGVKD